MSVIVMASQIQCLLVQWCRYGSVHLVGHGQFDGLFDILEGGITALCLYLAELKGFEIDALQVEHVDGAKFKARILDILDGIDL